MIKVDIANDVDIFNKAYGLNIKIKNVTGKRKSELEYWILGKTENLTYLADQWYGAETEYNKWNEETETFDTKIYRGEGDSTGHALLALMVAMKRTFEDNQIELIKDIFKH